MRKNIIAYICIIIIAVGVSYSILDNWRAFDVGYDTVNELIDNDNWFNNCEILEVLSDNDTYLVIYRDKTTLKKAILFSKNDRYYIYKNKNLYFEKFEKHYISVNYIQNKYVIDISSSFKSGDKVNISDSLRSDFKFYEGDFEGYIMRKWFVVLDELPDDYSIIINGQNLKISI